MKFRYRKFEIDGFEIYVLENPSQHIIDAYVKALTDKTHSKECYTVIFKGTKGFETVAEVEETLQNIPLDIGVYITNIPLDLWAQVRKEAEKKVEMLFQDTSS